MEGRFARAQARLHRVGAERLADSVGDYLDRSGAVIGGQVSLIIDKGVERVAEFDGALERITTIGVRKVGLPRIDLKGSFLIGGAILHVDDVESDDGHLITFYVRP
ncbi:hypothetical protein ACS8E9_09355 [Pseudomonas neustonica]|uniref:hypothetical protein n=1 Tax=Pseudomonas neustonica TaxID=2487346 RepID=UPI003F469154